MSLTIPNIYKGDIKILLIIPLLLIVISLYYIPQIKLGVDFTGGTLISLITDQQVDAAVLQQNLRNEGLEAIVKVADTTSGYKIEVELPQSQDILKADALKDDFTSKIDEVSRLEAAANQNASYLNDYLEKRKMLNNAADGIFALAGSNTKAATIGNLNTLKREVLASYKQVYDNHNAKLMTAINKYVTYSSVQTQSVSPTLSVHFIEKARDVVIYAVILSILLVFAFFRNIAPSIAVISGAVSDITIAMGAMGFFGIPLTIPSLAALLMLLGFSLDTDILLTMRTLRRSTGSDVRNKAHDAMKTGMTMSIMAIVAFSCLFALAYLTRISVYYEIAAVALAGLVGDIFATWGINAVIIIWFLERGMKKG